MMIDKYIRAIHACVVSEVSLLSHIISPAICSDDVPPPQILTHTKEKLQFIAAENAVTSHQVRMRPVDTAISRSPSSATDFSWDGANEPLMYIATINISPSNIGERGFLRIALLI